MDRSRAISAEFFPRQRPMGKSSEQSLWVINAGILGYEDAWYLQHGLKNARLEEKVGDTLILVQHPPTITLGRRGKEDNILVERDALKREGIELFVTDRGGDVTFHGPGQLVGYPIISLSGQGLSVSQYMRRLEDVIMRTLKDVGIIAKKIPHTIGVWVGEKKIASLGVRVSQGVTTHGFALNITNDLRPFQFINPCGMKGLQVTSLREILGEDVSCAYIENILVTHFSQVFQIRIGETVNLYPVRNYPLALLDIKYLTG
jgi:lipoate-protein ligase B